MGTLTLLTKPWENRDLLFTQGGPEGAILSATGGVSLTRTHLPEKIMKSLMRAGAAALALTTTAIAPAGAVLYMYEHINYQGLMGTRSVQGSWNMASQNNDELSSLENITPWYASMWVDANQRGRCVAWAPGFRDPSFRSGDNDVMSSYRLSTQAC